MLVLFLLEGFVPFIGDALVKFGGAAFAFRDEVETDTTDVLPGTEVLEIVDLLALDFKFEQTEVLQAHLVAHLQMAHHRIRYGHHQPFEYATADAHASGGSLFVKLMALDGLVVNGYCLVLAISWKRRLGFFLDSVSHIAFVDFGANLYNFLENQNYYLEYYDFLRNVHILLFKNLYFYIHNYIILHKHSDNQQYSC